MREVEERDSLVYDSEEEARRLQPPNKRKKAMTGAATYRTKFKNEWKKEFPWISSVSGDPHRFRCNICCVSILCDHQGKGDVKAHFKSTGHLHRAKALDKQPRLDCDPRKPTWKEVLRRQR